MESFKHKGSWWLPEGKPIKGTLTFSQIDGAFLYCDDMFTGVLHSAMHVFPIIFGESGRIKFTLINSSPWGPHGDKIGYQPMQILEGCHLSDVKKMFITGVTTACEDLHRWINISGFKAPITKTKKTATLKYTLPKPVDFNIGKSIIGNFSFSYDVRGKITHEVRLTQKVETTLQFTNEPLAYESALSQFTTFYQFLTFAIQRPPKINSVVLHTKEKTNNRLKKGTVSFYSKMRTGDEDFKPHFLFGKDDLPDFNHVISRWFYLNDKAGPAQRILFETYFSDFFLNENAFLNQCQAIESFHRNLYPPNAEELEKHKQRIQRISENTQHTEDKTWLQERFRYAYEQSFHKRMTSMLELIKDIRIITNLKIDNSFIRKVIDNRNYYTHYGEKKNGIAELSELARITIRLKMMLMIIFLHELGIPHKQIDQLANGRLTNWAFLMSPHHK